MLFRSSEENVVGNHGATIGELDEDTMFYFASRGDVYKRQVPGIVGIGKAAELAVANMQKNTEYEIKLRDPLIERVLHEIPYTRLNGDRTDRLPHNANFCFRFIEGESMLILLDQAGICGSSGSACTSGSLDPSHVLLAIGLPHEIAHGSLRLTLSEKTTMEEIDYTVDVYKRQEGCRPASVSW